MISLLYWFLDEAIDIHGYAKAGDLLGEPLKRNGKKVLLKTGSLDVRVLILEK